MYVFGRIRESLVQACRQIKGPALCKVEGAGAQELLETCAGMLVQAWLGDSAFVTWTIRVVGLDLGSGGFRYERLVPGGPVDAVEGYRCDAHHHLAGRMAPTSWAPVTTATKRSCPTLMRPRQPWMGFEVSLCRVKARSSFSLTTSTTAFAAEGARAAVEPLRVDAASEGAASGACVEMRMAVGDATGVEEPDFSFR